MRSLLICTLLMTACLAWANPNSDKGHTKKPGEQKVDFEEIEKQLTGDGLGGWVHGAVGNSQLFVFTWRHPDNFFVNVQLPMVPKDAQVAKEILNLRRHDFVVIKGKFIKSDAPLRHIEVTEFAEIKKWNGPGSDIDYDYKALPSDVYLNTSNTFKIHAVANGGAVIVVEYQDRVFPLLNKKPEMAKDLYRNDKVFFKYQVRGTPLNPTHLEIDYARVDPFLVVDRMVEGHGDTVEYTGPLVMFPKSPQIIFNVFALRQEDDLGLRRNFTLVNFEDIDLFLALRERLEKVWQEQDFDAEYDRNKFINRRIIVTAKGMKNVVDPNQANPQILIQKMEDLKIKVIPANKTPEK